MHGTIAASYIPMAINPIDTTLAVIADRTVPKVVADSLSASSFNQFITSAIQQKSATGAKDMAEAASAAAELMRLEMMKNALSIDDTGTGTLKPAITSPVNIVIANLLKESQIVDSASAADQNQTPAISATTPQPLQLSSSPAIEEIIGKASRQYGVDVALIKAVIKTESNFNPKAVSHAGAQGLMQLMPGTARGLGVTDSFDPGQNIMAGTRFLKDMLKRYHGNMDSALAAYNWGPGNVDRKGTAKLPQETQEYLVRVKSYYNQYAG